jgi:formate dehydrogenase subunit delta
MHTDEKLAMMANQIAAFFAAQGEERAVPAIADHIGKFWDPQMRRKFLSLAEGAGDTLHPLVRKAVPLIR